MCDVEALMMVEGDLELLTAARIQARTGFNGMRALVANSDEAQKGIKHAQDVAAILRENIVQGRQAGEDGSYRIKIHEHTERGDNDTVKDPRGGTVKISGGCS